MSNTESARLADAYAFIAQHPRCLTSEVAVACPAYDWAVSELERRGLIVRVALRPSESCEGRWATVASKVV